MTIWSTSGVLVVLAVVMLLWFVPRSMRRASAADAPEQSVVGHHSMTDDVLASHSILFSEESAVPGSDPKKTSNASGGSMPALSEEETSAALSGLREASPAEPFTGPVPVLEQEPWLPERLHRLGTGRLILLGFGVLVALMLIFSLILAIMGWLPWSAPTVSAVLLAGIGGVLYYMGPPKEHEDELEVHPETSEHAELPAEDELSADHAEGALRQGGAYETVVEEPEPRVKNRSSKARSWSSLRWNSGRGPHHAGQDVTAQDDAQTGMAPQIDAAEFEYQAHEEEYVHEDSVEYAETHPEDAPPRAAETSRVRRLPAQLHPKYSPQEASAAMPENTAVSREETSHETVSSAPMLFPTGTEPVQGTPVQAQNLRRVAALSPEAQRHESQTRFTAPASGQMRSPRRPGRVPGTHLRPLARTNEPFDQEAQTVPTGQLPQTQPAASETLASGASSQNTAAPQGNTRGGEGQAPEASGQVRASEPARQGFGGTPAHDENFGDPARVFSGDRRVGSGAYPGQSQGFERNPGYATSGYGEQATTPQNTASQGLGSPNPVHRDGAGQGHPVAPGFAPSRTVADEKNLPPASFTPQGAIRPTPQGSAEPWSSQRPAHPATGSVPQASQHQQAPTTGSVPVGTGSGFTNTSQFDVPVPIDIDDSEFEPFDVIPVVDEPAERSGSGRAASYGRGNTLGTGASFTGVSQKTWTPTQLPKPLSSLHQKKSSGGENGTDKNGQK